ncbi:transaldolase [Arhodomonas sp. AD133]|uniref:transaldolase n=1 Tax=Arhodomonas sp. AD133 TaxID=3415009 RepID=UPI003EB8D866
MTTRLDNLSKLSTIVADTGEIELIERFRPQDCTTNPSLLLKAVHMDAYRDLVDDAVDWGRDRAGTRDRDVEAVLDRLAVNFGSELLRLVPGYVSTEVDAALSFDTQGTIDKARQLIELYRERDVDPQRVLIKIAATWEGIQAARVLQREGINCNMTLIFSLAQAVACAEAGAFLVSPFVGRITDWYKAATGEDYAPDDDPGVQSVKRIYEYFKAYGHQTVVMAASFRTTGQVEALAGCDRLTISPQLLDELRASGGEVPRRLYPDMGGEVEALDVSEPNFRWLLNEDAMATEKLAEGIRRFHADTATLREHVRALL